MTLGDQSGISQAPNPFPLLQTHAEVLAASWFHRKYSLVLFSSFIPYSLTTAINWLGLACVERCTHVCWASGSVKPPFLTWQASFVLANLGRLWPQKTLVKEQQNQPQLDVWNKDRLSGSIMHLVSILWSSSCVTKVCLVRGRDHLRALHDNLMKFQVIRKGFLVNTNKWSSGRNVN